MRKVRAKAHYLEQFCRDRKWLRDEEDVGRRSIQGGERNFCFLLAEIFFFVGKQLGP